MSGNSLVKADQMEVTPFDSIPTYLPENTKHTGMESMDRDDFKIPRILLLQPLSPQIQTFEGLAKANQFWHTGMNVPLGAMFDFVPLVANKRVILWRPRDDQEGGILAFSRNGEKWDTGANQEFRVKLRGVNEPVVWKTGPDVLSSGLTRFGTSNPADSSSPPAASTVYEYLCYLPANPELSPCVLSVSKTALPNGKNFNTSLMMLIRQKRPIWCVGVRCFADQMTGSGNKWTVPNFKLLGYVPEATFKVAEDMSKNYGEYITEYTQDEDNGTSENKKGDEIPF